MSMEQNSHEEIIFDKSKELSLEVGEDMEQHQKFFEDKDNLDVLVQAASMGREVAESHRQFFVGAAALGVRLDRKTGEYVYDAYSGANYTPLKKDPPAAGFNKRCAEWNFVQSGVDDGVEFFPAIITISKETNTGDPSKAHDALHPCLDCRHMIRKMIGTGLMRADTIFYHINDKDPKNIKILKMTAGELLNAYQDDPPVPEGF